jgi:hypothetical protein
MALQIDVPPPPYYGGVVQLDQPQLAEPLFEQFNKNFFLDDDSLVEAMELAFSTAVDLDGRTNFIPFQANSEWLGKGSYWVVSVLNEAGLRLNMKLQQVKGPPEYERDTREGALEWSIMPVSAIEPMYGDADAMSFGRALRLSGPTKAADFVYNHGPVGPWAAHDARLTKMMHVLATWHNSCDASGYGPTPRPFPPTTARTMYFEAHDDIDDSGLVETKYWGLRLDTNNMPTALTGYPLHAMLFESNAQLEADLIGEGLLLGLPTIGFEVYLFDTGQTDSASAIGNVWTSRFAADVPTDIRKFSGDRTSVLGQVVSTLAVQKKQLGG